MWGKVFKYYCVILVVEVSGKMSGDVKRIELEDGYILGDVEKVQDFR